MITKLLIIRRVVSEISSLFNAYHKKEARKECKTNNRKIFGQNKSLTTSQR
jgi:hypothetical protein